MQLIKWPEIGTIVGYCCLPSLISICDVTNLWLNVPRGTLLFHSAQRPRQQRDLQRQAPSFEPVVVSLVCGTEERCKVFHVERIWHVALMRSYKCESRRVFHVERFAISTPLLLKCFWKSSAIDLK